MGSHGDRWGPTRHCRLASINVDWRQIAPVVNGMFSRGQGRCAGDIFSHLAKLSQTCEGFREDEPVPLSCKGTAPAGIAAEKCAEIVTRGNHPASTSTGEE